MQNRRAWPQCHVHVELMNARHESLGASLRNLLGSCPCVFAVGSGIIWRLCSGRYFSKSPQLCFQRVNCQFMFRTVGDNEGWDGNLSLRLLDETPLLLPFCSQGQNPFESDDFTKNGSHLLDSSFNFDSSPRHGEY